MSIFDDINAGTDRLRRGEDALIWQMRASGHGWREIGTELLMRRQLRRERCMAMLAIRNPRVDRAARVARDRLRQERA